MTLKEVTLQNIKTAYEEKIKHHIHYTQMIYADKISEITGNNIYLKLENLQKTGSFKIRGAINKIQNLSAEEKQKGLVAASAGNHAQGVALAAQLLGTNATIIMPKTAPIAKIQATISYGAQVILHGEFFDDCLEYAKQLATDKKLVLIHAYDDVDIIIGQGSIALEIIDEIKNIDYCLVPIGGGGIMSGIATVLKTINPKIKMIGVEAENVNSYQQAKSAGKPVPIKGKASIADGIAVKRTGTLTFKILQKYVDQVITVSEAEIANAVLFLLEKCKIVTEGSGAVGVAAILSDKLKIKDQRKNIVSIITGGNVDITTIGNIINKGLFSQGRRQHFSIITNLGDDTLNEVTNIIKKSNAVIIKIDSTINRFNLELQQMKIDFVIDTLGQEHSDKVIKQLTDAGYTTIVS